MGDLEAPSIWRARRNLWQGRGEIGARWREKGGIQIAGLAARIELQTSGGSSYVVL
jgi:hypothetical protein